MATLDRIKFGVNVFLNLNEMIQNGADLRKGVQDAISQDSNVMEDLFVVLESEFDDASAYDKVCETIDKAEIPQLMKYISIIRKDTIFDAEESAYLDDPAEVAFLVSCVLDLKGFLLDSLPVNEVERILG